MTYILEDLLDLRKHREQTSLHSLMRTIQAVKDAKSAREKKANQLTDYIEWRRKEENRLFETLRHTIRNIHDLMAFNQQIEALREKENQLVDALKRADEAIQEAKNKRQKAKNQYAQAHRETEKLESHKHIWLLEKYTQDERLADNEHDEIALSKVNMSPVL